MILDRVVNIARLTPDNSDNDKEAYVTVLNGVRMNIQPASAELIALSEGQIGRTFRAYTAVSTIKISDQITVSGTGTRYIVKGVDDWHFGNLPHLELLLFLGDE